MRISKMCLNQQFSHSKWVLDAILYLTVSIMHNFLIYSEYKERVDVIDNDTEDSLTYTPYDLFKFNPNKSTPLSDNDYVTIIHPVIVVS